MRSLMLVFIYRKSIYLLLLLSFSISSSLLAQDSSNSGFIPASSIKLPRPIYPKTELSDGNAGMVEIEMMIDENGKVFSPVILRSTAQRFEDAALTASKEYVYAPATYNGKPVQSRKSIRISFFISEQKDAVSREFSYLYRRAIKELNKAEPSPKKINKLLSRMKLQESLTSYALARYNLVALHAAVSFGEADHQIEATRKLLMFDKQTTDKGRALDAETTMSVRTSLFFLLVRTQRYAEALSVYRAIKRENPKAAVDFEEMVSKIRLFENSEGAAEVAVDLGSRGYVVEKLFKKSLMVSDIKGNVQVLKFRCDRRFKELVFQADSEYKIPASWGECLVEIVGEPNSLATLIQF